MLSEFITRVFDLPEFVISKVDPTGQISYLYVIGEIDPKCNSIWTANQDDALLFYDISDIKQLFRCYNREDYLVFSYLDCWSDSEIRAEFGYYKKQQVQFAADNI